MSTVTIIGTGNMGQAIAGIVTQGGNTVQLLGSEDLSTPATGEICAFCRLVDTASAHDPVPVELVMGKRGRR